MSYSGVLVSAWVKIEGECSIEYNVCGDEVEFSLGGHANGFQFLATERGLENLVASGSEALRAMRANDE